MKKELICVLMTGNMERLRSQQTIKGEQVMKYLTAEQIADRTNNKEGLANIRAINALYRAQDESSLYPINGRFNATERAIRRVRKVQQASGTIYGLEYCYALEGEISRIVNQEN